MTQGPFNAADRTDAGAPSSPSPTPDDAAPADAWSDEDSHHGDVARTIVKWVTRASVAGFAISFIAHLVFLFVSGVISFGGGGRGGPALPGGAVEVAFMTEGELGALQEASFDAQTPGVGPSSNLPAPEIVIETSMEMPGGQGLMDAGDLGAIGEGLGGAGTGTGIGIGPGAGGAGGGSAKWFGVEARGSRFVYIVDISGSMAENNRLDIMKDQLVKSVDGLPENSSFHVFFFESDVVPILRRERWMESTGRWKSEAIRAIRAIDSRGGTMPMKAFEMAFALRPRPDAIYFMTDGMFDRDVIGAVDGLNTGKPKIPIHCIAFQIRDSELMMRQMARDSGGSYTFVDRANK
jgi:hypothetical protein